VIELAVPPSTNATQLFRFMCQLDERLHSDYNSTSIMHTVGSWDRGTVITISLSHGSLANVLDKIRGMSEVEKVEEEELARDAFSRSPMKFGSLPSLSISSSKRICLTLK